MNRLLEIKNDIRGWTGEIDGFIEWLTNNYVTTSFVALYLGIIIGSNDCRFDVNFGNLQDEDLQLTDEEFAMLQQIISKWISLKSQERCRFRTIIIFEELLANALHPRRLMRLLNYGGTIDDF